MKDSFLDMTQKAAISCISEENYQAEMVQTVEPYLKQYLINGYYESLYYELFPQENAKGMIVISYGFTEACEKYHELIYYFHKMGYQAAILDHRGHGKTVREVENKNIVSIRHFSQYVDDLHGFITIKVQPMNNGKSLYLYAHSMGGCIAALYLEQHPTVFTKAVLNAPMLGIRLGNVPSFLARILCRFFILLGKGKERVFVTQEFQRGEPSAQSAGNSEARHNYYRELRDNNEVFQTNCCSYFWLHASILAGRQAIKPENVKKIQTPLLMFQATDDDYVRKKEQDRFLAVLDGGEVIHVHSRHEISRSSNGVLEIYLSEIFSFFQ